MWNVGSGFGTWGLGALERGHECSQEKPSEAFPGQYPPMGIPLTLLSSTPGRWCTRSRRSGWSRCVVVALFSRRGGNPFLRIRFAQSYRSLYPGSGRTGSLPWRLYLPGSNLPMGLFASIPTSRLSPAMQCIQHCSPWCSKLFGARRSCMTTFDETSNSYFRGLPLFCRFVNLVSAFCG